MTTDKMYCMCSYLMYRYIVRDDVCFSDGIFPVLFNTDFDRQPVSCSTDLDSVIRDTVSDVLSKGTVGLMLSGGIDSAILARYLPKGTKAYTLRCIADNAVDESFRAKKYAEENNLDHKIVEVTWEDYLQYTSLLMKRKNAPIHSIEPQIYKAALQAKRDGITHLLFGENADIIYGGMDGLLAKDWNYDDFIDRYMYIDPPKVLKGGKRIIAPFQEYLRDNGKIDFVGFINHHFYREACGTYTNACELAGVEYVSPYTKTYLSVPLDLERIRKGDTKYIVRELYCKLYPNIQASKKLPMPRPVSTWLRNWDGPVRTEFFPDCVKNMTGDQRWMLWSLEKFLNQLEE